MPAVMAPEVLADPIGVVADLVLDIESALAREVIAETVERVAGGRAKRRRLAQALVDKPALLTEGRSPAPRVVGDLLIALRKAGAAGVAPPACAECGKHLRCLQRRGEDWYCAVCGPRPRRCSFCGQDRIVAGLDRQGRPRCGQCPDHDGRDPLAILCQVITRLEPSLTAEAITAAARRVHRPAKLLQLAWAIEDTPTLLTGQAAQAPMPSVLRLIDELRGAGAQRITRPACPRCHRIVRLHRRIGRLWLCRNCVAKSQAQPCSRCGAVREARHPRRARQSAVSLLPDQRPSQPRDLHRLRPSASGQCPNTRRAPVPDLPPPQDPGLRDLRAHRGLHGLHRDRPTMVPGLPETLGPMHRLRERQAGARRHGRRAGLRHLRTPGSRVLAHVPDLRAERAASLRSLHPLHRATTAA